MVEGPAEMGALALEVVGGSAEDAFLCGIFVARGGGQFRTWGLQWCSSN